jgi:hypothetical protein
MCVQEIRLEVMVKIYWIQDGDEQWESRNTRMHNRVPRPWDISSQVALFVKKEAVSWSLF